MVGLRVALLAGIGLGSQCQDFEDGGGAPVRGSREDVTTQMGAYRGAQVTEDCDSSDAFGVLAIQPFEPEQELTGSEHHAMTRAAVDAALHDAGLGDVAGGSGWGRACQGLGATFSVSDWAEVDPLIDAMLPLVRAGNIVNDVEIRVEAPPVAH